MSIKSRSAMYIFTQNSMTQLVIFKTGPSSYKSVTFFAFPTHAITLLFQQDWHLMSHFNKFNWLKHSFHILPATNLVFLIHFESLIKRRIIEWLIFAKYCVSVLILWKVYFLPFGINRIVLSAKLIKIDILWSR